MTVPALNIKLPRPVTSLHQIEITSRCNLRCSFCVSPHLGRLKLDMDESTFLRALEWVAYYRDRGTQGELNLAGIGESTMHPKFAEWLPLARIAVGPNARLVIATNGVTFTEAIAKAAAEVNLRVCVSLHRPEVAGPAIALATRYGVFEGVSADPSLNTNDWAGQVKIGYKTTPRALACPWIRSGWMFCLADGGLSHCCLDADGSGVFAHVDSPMPGEPAWEGVASNLETAPFAGNLKTAPWKLCKTCYQDIAIVGYAQRS